jgi:hypothetical protein
MPVLALSCFYVNVHDFRLAAWFCGAPPNMLQDGCAGPLVARKEKLMMQAQSVRYVALLLLCVSHLHLPFECRKMRSSRLDVRIATMTTRGVVIPA